MLNVAILAAGVGLLSSNVPLAVPMVVFAAGLASATLAWLASTTQHSYYKNVRDLKARLEQRIGVGGFAIATTTGMGGPRWRLARITTFQKLILGALFAADLVGLGTAIAQATASSPPAKVEVVVQANAGDRHPSRAVPVVFSRRGRIVASTIARPGKVVTVRLTSGGYRVSAFGRQLCVRRARITGAPLQRLVVDCP